MILNSWSVSIRHIWNLPPQTHGYLIEPLGGTHIKTMIFSRFTNFIQSILKTDKKAVLYRLFKAIYNQRTITGKNVNSVLKSLDETNILEVNVNNMKRNLKFHEIPKNLEWKVNLVKELTNLKLKILCVDFKDDLSLSTDEIDDILTYIATS